MDKTNQKGLVFSYDKTADILYFSIGKPQQGIDEETEAGIFIRINPKTKKPNGIMIIDFLKRFSKTETKPLPIQIKDLSLIELTRNF